MSRAQAAKPKILLLSLNTESAPYLVYPLGMAYMEGALRRRGCVTSRLDAHVMPPDRLMEAVKVFRPDVLGISIRNIDNVDGTNPRAYTPAAVELVRRLREDSATPMVLGGSGFSLFPEELMSLTHADAGVCGAGEPLIGPVVDALIAGRPLPRRHGVVAGRGRKLGAASLEEPPSAGGYVAPQREHQLLQWYLDRSGVANAQTRRGCPFHCVYCTYGTVEGGGTLRIPLEAVLEDMRAVERAGARYVFLVDSVFNVNRDHCLELAEALIRSGIRLKWGAFFRPQGLISEDYRLLKRAGLRHVEFGTDTLCEDTCRTYQKGFTPDDVLASDSAAREHGIHVCHYLLLGGAGETMDTVRRTMDTAVRLKNSLVMPFFGMRIYPGTILEKIAEKEGLISNDGSLLQPVFYFAPELDQKRVMETARQKALGLRNWIFPEEIGDLCANLDSLRRKGKTGPLWEFAPYRSFDHSRDHREQTMPGPRS